MDAMPVTLGQELGGWRTQIEKGIERIAAVEPRLLQLAQGGTAVGTGINAHPEFAARFAQELAQRHRPRVRAQRQPVRGALPRRTRRWSCPASCKTLAVSLMKIANDLRWMNSGPLAGLGEIALPALQPGSSIMPGKVNPVIPEAVAMVAAQVIGNDATITVAGQSGNFQLNVMLPLIGYNLLRVHPAAGQRGARAGRQGHRRASRSTRRGLQEALERNPILVTALNPVIGYEKGAAIAKKAYAEGKPILEVAAQNTDLSRGAAAGAARSGRAHARRHQGRKPAEEADGRRGRTLAGDRRCLAAPAAAPGRFAPLSSPGHCASSARSLPSPPIRASRAMLPTAPRAAAVLVGLIEPDDGEQGILLTVRAAHLRQHAGQIAFPGGAIDAGRRGSGGRGIARGAAKKWASIRLRAEVIGYLPDQFVLTGFRITPVVARLPRGFHAAVWTGAEVQASFILPFAVLLDPATERPGRRRVRWHGRARCATCNTASTASGARPPACCCSCGRWPLA